MPWARPPRRRLIPQCGWVMINTRWYYEVAIERRLADIGEALSSTQGEAMVRTAFQFHIDSMERFLSKHQIAARSVTDRDLAEALRQQDMILWSSALR